MITYKHNSNRNKIIRILWYKEMEQLSSTDLRKLAYRTFKRDLKGHTTETLTDHAVDIKGYSY